MRFNLQFLLCVCLSISLNTQFVHAAFILDDFDDAAQVTSPEMENEFVTTENVGAMNAVRSIRIAGLRGDPDAHLDSSITTTSLLTGRVNRLNPDSVGGSTIAAIQSNYQFTQADFTQSGTNDTLFFDFVQLTSEIPPSLFLLLLNDGNNYYSYIDQSDFRNNKRFTLAVPFNSFTTRGGAPGLPDYRTIQSFNLEIRASQLTGGGPTPLNFLVELDQIRVGKIPEPTTSCLLGLASLVFAFSRLSRQHLLAACFVLCLCPTSARAAFILDDFDDPAEVVMEGAPVVTNGVGDLSAERTLAFFDIFTTPIARIDSNLTRPSHLTAVRSAASPTDGLGLARLGPIYRFDDIPQDFTQNGQNNAFFVDFTSITGPTPPPLLFGFVKDGRNFYEIFFDLNTIFAPATVVLPFDRFRPRGGGLGQTDFKNVTQISIRTLGNGTVNRILEQGWRLEIDRIRVGNIPEPTTSCLLVLASIAFSFQRFSFQKSFLIQKG